MKRCGTMKLVRRLFRISLVLLLLPVFSYGQSRFFQAIPLNSTAYYFPVQDTVCYGACWFSTRIDSMRIQNGDTIFYFPPVVKEDTSSSCDYHAGDAGWLGPHYVRKSNGEYLFFNRDGDTIHFLPSATSGQVFDLYRAPNGNRYTVRVQVEVRANLFGTIEWVKRMKIRSHDTLGNLNTLPWGGKLIYVGRNYGFYNIFSFRDFPYDTTEYQIAGISIPDPPDNIPVDTLVANAANIFEFHPGDEFHYRIRESTIDGSIWHYRHTLEKRLMLNSEMTGDTLKYLFWRVQWTKDSTSAGDIDTFFNIDSVQEIITLKDYAFLDHDDDEMTTGLNGQAVIEVFNAPEYNYRIQKAVLEPLNGADSCLYLPVTNPDHRYAIGLGQVYYYESLQPTGGFFEKKLIYYQKGIETWGEPIWYSQLLPVAPAGQGVAVTVYPVPASDFIYIKMPATAGASVAFMIYDPAGKRLDGGKLRLDGSTGKLNLRGYPPGIYLLQLITALGQVFIHKLVIGTSKAF